MSGEGAAAIRTWPVGKRTCTMTVQRFKPGQVMSATCEWAPDQPSRLTTEEWREYAAGRNHALTGIAAELGVTVGVLDL